MAAPRCSKGFIKEASSYSKSYSNKNSVDGRTAYSFTNSSRANFDTVSKNNIPNSVSEKWPSSKSSYVSKACSEDFPTLSSSFTSSYKPSKKNSDILPETKKPIFASYSDKLRNNTKSNCDRYFNENIVASSKDSDKNTEKIYKRNATQSSLPSCDRQAFNENTRITSKLSPNYEVNQLSQSSKDRNGNVVKGNSAEGREKLTAQNCDKNKTVIHKSNTELGVDEHHKNKAPSDMLSDESALHDAKQSVQSKSSWWKVYSNRKNKPTLVDSQDQHSVKSSDKPDYDCGLNGKKAINYEQQRATNWLNKEQRKHKENHPHKDNNAKMTNTGNSQNFRNSNNVKRNTISKPNSRNSSTHPKQELEVPKKHKKKRLAKVKRQTAFQTGKILVLSPEFHSRIVQNLTNSESNVSNNEVADIDNLSEYPSLAVTTTKIPKQTLPWPQLSQRPNPTTNVVSQGSSLELRTNEIYEHRHNIIKNEKLLSENNEPPSSVFSEDEATKKDKGQDDIPWDESGLKVKQCPREPIQLFDILAVTKPKEKSKKKIEVVPKSEQTKTKPEQIKTGKPIKVRATSHAPNWLDSSAPVKRGKEREHPKQKKVTPLKKIILSERLKKKESQISTIESFVSKDSETIVEVSGCSMLKDGMQDIQSSLYEIVEEKLHTNYLDAKPVENLEQEDSDHLLKLELIADTAEAIVDKVVELAVTKVRMMGLNVNAACFEISCLAKNESEYINDSTFQCNENSDHFQSSTVLPSENHTLISSQTNHQIKYPDCRTKLTEIGMQPVIETYTVTNEEDEESSKDLYPKWSENERNLAVQTVIHMKIFREYCTHLLSKELNDAVLLLVDTLAGFQDRQHQKDPVKARMKRRLVYGIKEVKKYLKLKKLKCVVMAPDLEDIKTEGGLNTELASIIKTTKEFHIPCVFAAERKQLGRACHKAVPVSCLGIFSYEGSEACFKKIIELYEINIKDYQTLVKMVNSHLTDENIQEILDTKDILETRVRSRIFKSILSKENMNPDLPSKYDANVLEWFSGNYCLKIA